MGSEYLFYTLDYIIQYCVIYFVAQAILALAILFCFLSTPLLSGATRCSRLILYFPYSSPRINHFSKESCFLLLYNGIRNQDVGEGLLAVTVVSLFLGPLSGQSKEISKYILAHTYL